MENNKQLNGYKDKLDVFAIVSRYVGAIFLSAGLTLDIAVGIRFAQSDSNTVRDAIIFGAAAVFDGSGLGSIHMAGAISRRADVLHAELLRRENDDKRWSLDIVPTEGKE
jgi:hypothetical protein